MVKKEITSVKNLKEAFWETALCSVNSSHRVTVFPQDPFGKDYSCGICKVYLEVHKGLWWKWKYPKIKTEKKLSVKLLCVLLFISQSYSFPLKNSFTETILVKFAKWYLEAHRGLWWKRKYLPLKTGKQHSEKLPCVLLIYLTELQLSPQEAFR